MMNNIEINDKLETDIENKYIKFKKNVKFTTEEAIYILKRKDFCDEVENIAIENLIQENKEYEEGKKLSQKQEEMIIKVIQEAAEERIPKEMKNFISKNKIKEIIYPTPENYIPLEVQSSEMYKKLEKLVEGE